MTYIISITDDQVFTSLRNWILGSAVLSECVQGPINRASMPRGGENFVVMSPTLRARLSLNTTDYPTQDTQTNTASFDYSIQIDCYGPNSGDTATILHDSWYSDQAFNLLKPQGVSPLWIEEPRFVPLVNGEQQYENRWTMGLHLQFKPAITDAQQSASDVSINPANIINVDVRYPG
jgi:hypothetical protein